MNYKWLGYFLFLCAGLALPARAQLQFTNVSNTNLNNLSGITCGVATNSIAGGSNYVFIAVGANSSVVTWTFTNPVSNASQNTNWIQKQVSGASGLYAAAFGGNQFLVTGDSNVVFSSTDAVNWTSNGTVFANSARAQGMAFNNGTFVAVASAPEIAWSTNATTTPWGSATITNLSFADSFRGVTAFNLSSNSSNFAACGILGRLATSSDGGRDWATPYGAIGRPDLFGITSDNRQTLVCVGANGAILTLTNGGTLWSSNSWGASTLNAVSYVGTNYLGTNYGFIAVGDNGSVLTSVEGTNWTTINTNVLANANKLNGVMFATSGQFKGIGVLVGDHGTIILAGTPPQPPVDITPAQTNCAGEINFPLVVKFNTFDYPIGALVVDWSTNAGFSTLETNISTIGETNDFVPPVVTSNITITNVYYVRIRDIRTGLSSTSIMVTNIVYEQPTIESNLITSPICNGESDTNQLVLTGHGPWTVMWSDGAVSNYTASPASRYLSALEVINVFQNMQTNYTFVITNLTDSYCTAQTINLFFPPFNPLASNTNSVTVNPRPTATLLSTNFAGYIFAATNCNDGTSYTITNILTGIGVWTVQWNDATVQYTNAAPGSPATLLRTVYPTNSFGAHTPSNNVYYITSVQDTNMCEPGDILGTNTIVVNPLPSGVPVSNGNKTNCVGVANPPLTVTDTNSVIWYDTHGDVMASYTNSFTPTNSTTGVWTYYAAEVSASGCTNGNVIQVNLVLVPCTNLITSITLSGTNVLISWSGDYVLQSATNLTPPVMWTPVFTQAVVAPYTWTNSTVPPPTNNFFRLYAPTN